MSFRYKPVASRPTSPTGTDQPRGARDESLKTCLTGLHALPTLTTSTHSLNKNYTYSRLLEHGVMKWGKCKLGSLKIDGEEYSKDIVLDRGELSRRKKKPSREFRQQFGHTPVSLQEEIP